MSGQQLSMFDLLEPKPERVAYVPPPKREVWTKAYGGKVLAVFGDDPDPIELEVRGIPFVAMVGSLQTYAAQPAGSLFWSETGYRSFGSDFTGLEDQIALAVERYIDGPVKHGAGCGGKLERWWPSYALQWQQNLGFALSVKREETWDQWGPAEHASHWLRHDLKQAEALERMVAEGIDPNDIGKPRGFRGTWPKFTAEKISQQIERARQ